MSIRGEVNKKRDKDTKRVVRYETLLDFIRDRITEKYGSLSRFIEHADFKKKCKFEDKDKRNFLNYFSCSDNKVVKSMPTLKKTYKGLLGIELESATEVIRVTHIYVPDNFKIKG